MRKLKNFVISFISNIIYFFRKNNIIHFTGTFKNWEEAKKHSKGYNDLKILEKVKYSANQVLSGKATYERDGVAFFENNFSYQTLATILRASIENKNKCKVIDFGGSLGSTYYQNRSFFKHIKNLKWIVVEQNTYVRTGKKYFSNKIIKFYESIEEATKYLKKPNVAIVSGTIQYLPNPYIVLNKIIKTNVDYIVIDRNPFIIKGKTKLTVQKIPKKIVKSSYPIWLFGENEFRKIFKKKYKEIATFDALDGVIGYGKLKACYKGIIYKRKNSN